MPRRQETLKSIPSTSVIAQVYNPEPGRWRLESQEFRVILSYMVSLRLAWEAEDPVSKQNKIRPTLSTSGRCLKNYRNYLLQ